MPVSDSLTSRQPRSLRTHEHAVALGAARASSGAQAGERSRGCGCGHRRIPERRALMGIGDGTRHRDSVCPFSEKQSEEEEGSR